VLSRELFSRFFGPGWAGRPGPFGLLESAYINHPSAYINHNVFLLLW
jgi:hypothetical protein